MVDPLILPPKKPVLVDEAETDTFPESGGPCEDCAHSIFPEDKDRWGQCRAKQPKLQIFLLPPRVANGRPDAHPIATWPQVSRRQGCGEYRLRKSKQQ